MQKSVWLCCAPSHPSVHFGAVRADNTLLPHPLQRTGSFKQTEKPLMQRTFCSNWSSNTHPELQELHFHWRSDTILGLIGFVGFLSCITVVLLLRWKNTSGKGEKAPQLLSHYTSSKEKGGENTMKIIMMGKTYSVKLISWLTNKLEN